MKPALLPVLAGPAARAWIEGTSAAAAGTAAGAGGAAADEPPVDEAVRRILAEVRAGGDDALRRCAEAYDGGTPSALRVPPVRCAEALAALSAERREALEFARDNIARRHRAQIRREAPVEILPGVSLWREFRPIRRVGLYVPGGRAAYASSLLMTAVPARVAGCDELVACSPAGPTGEPAEAVMAAAALVGVDELYAIGGAHAIAAMAYGTETITPVDKIFGPGGAWANAAKLAVFGTVAIDLPAGPSEIAVWADGAADPDRVAAEIVAQAEHGPDSICFVVLSDSGQDDADLPGLAAQIRERAVDRCAALAAGPGEPGEAARAALAAGAVVVAANDAEAVDWLEIRAPEHLSIQTRDPLSDLRRVRSAGAVFLGPSSAVAAGDYCTGGNHVLPTGGRARGAGGLDLDAFGRWISVQRLTPEGLGSLAPAIATLAEWEGLPAHARSVVGRGPGGLP